MENCESEHKRTWDSAPTCHVLNVDLSCSQHGTRVSGEVPTRRDRFRILGRKKTLDDKGMSRKDKGLTLRPRTEPQTPSVVPTPTSQRINSHVYRGTWGDGGT